MWARKHARHVGMWARKHARHVGMWARKHARYIGTWARKARWHASTFLARRTRNLADSFNWRRNYAGTTLIRRCATLFRCYFNVRNWRCINAVQHLKHDVGFCLIFNVEPTLFQRWSTTLKQRWSDVEILAGLEWKNYVFVDSNFKHSMTKSSLSRIDFTKFKI